jgi:hypothetical protein
MNCNDSLPCFCHRPPSRRLLLLHLGLHDDVCVQKVRRDHVRRERRVPVLKNDGHDVVSNVPLALQLLRVVLRVREEGGDVEHDLAVVEALVQRVISSLAVLGVQAASEDESKVG